MSDIDPLTSQIDQLQSSLNQPTGASTVGAVASVEVGVDGSLQAIHLTDVGRRLDPDTLVAEIVRLHAEALAESRKAIAAAIAQIENDPRLRALKERGTDALNQPRPQQQAPAASPPPVPQPPAQPGAVARSQPRLSPEPIASTRPRPQVQTEHSQPSAAPPRATPSAPPTARPTWPRPQATTQPAEPLKSREPTQEEEEEMDRYYQRKSWLEY
ncbi:hypothetical protein [Nocardia sp. CA-120079]|uniref:hypothetical protein n=1 Tax=Nocardia sp. CA-120079 TaxID=3239974 RepID=UPI003D9515F3